MVMRRLVIMALVLTASVSFSTLSAKDKKKNVKAQVCEKPYIVNLKTYKDSLSYAAGMALTNGMRNYLEKEYGITDSLMPEVARGFREKLRQRKDSSFTAYMAGLQLADMVGRRMIPGLGRDFSAEDSLDTELIYQGFLASVDNYHREFTDSMAQEFFNKGLAVVKDKKVAALKKDGVDFLNANRQKEGVVELADGLQYKVLKEGNGPKPTATDDVEVIYEGRTIDGNVFDATSKHGKETDTFNVSGLIKGWTEVLQLRPVGSKWEVYIPQELAYGERGAGRNIKPYQALIFTMELVGIKEKKQNEEKATESETPQKRPVRKFNPKKGK